MATALAVVLLLDLSAWPHNGTGHGVEGSECSYQPGSTDEGIAVTYVFAEDRFGAPLISIQLFDQDGSPLSTAGPDEERISGYSNGTKDMFSPVFSCRGQAGGMSARP